MKLDVNGKEVNLKVSVWVVDENRLQNLMKGREGGTIWNITAMFFVCHQNWARKNKVPVAVEIEELEDWVDEMLSEPTGQKQLIALFNELNNEIGKLFENTTAEAAIEPEQKKIFGEALESSPLLKSA